MSFHDWRATMVRWLFMFFSYDFIVLPIQPQPPNLHEIQQPKLLVVPRGRHPPIIVRTTEQASHQSGERKGSPFTHHKHEPQNSLA